MNIESEIIIKMSSNNSNILYVQVHFYIANRYMNMDRTFGHTVVSTAS